MRLYDGYPTKSGAKSYADDLRFEGVQYVRVKPINQGRLKYGVFIAGRNSSKY